MDLSKITNTIPKEVYKWSNENAGAHFSFVSVLSYKYGEIIERSFAIRKYAKKGTLITEVRRRATGNSTAIVKNLLFSRFGGYIPVFEKGDRRSNNQGWNLLVFSEDDFDQWYEANLPCNFYCLCLNKELLTETEEFKYCGYSCGDVIDYLNKYRQNPMVEYFGKLDLPLSASLIAKADKDKCFKSFLTKNVSNIREYGTQATVYAYNHNMSISEASYKLNTIRKARKLIPELRGRRLNEERILDYCKENGIGYTLYNDYIKAVATLGLDLQDTKNLYPKDFTAMHNLRVAEYESFVAKVDREKRKELYDSFALAGEKATAYEYTDNGYTLVAPRDISELKTEGTALDHCVGRMGYDKKMADGKVVIMFLRQTTDIAKPFVTIEYDLHQLKLLQAYAQHNSKPSAEAMTFINKWEQAMKERMSKQILTNSTVRSIL